VWDHDSLYKKAKLYVRKGLDHEEPGSPEVPFWCLLSLELLARAALSRVSPALLADPQDGANVLYACGFPGKTAPRSIAAKTVFRRCQVVCSGFTERELNKCIEWLNWRNEELHSGGLPFEHLTTSKWLPDFFQVANILLKANKQTLKDYAGGSHVKTARTMLEALSSEKMKQAHEMVQTMKSRFSSLSKKEQRERLSSGTEQLAAIYKRGGRPRKIKCPACAGPAVLIGSIIRSTTPRDENGQLVQEDVWLPVGLKCYACELTLKEHAHVNALGLGDQYTSLDTLDPADYYSIEFDPADYYEDDYGND
jgi:hypothetical protein